MRIFVSYSTRDGYLSGNRLTEVRRVVSRYGVPFIDALEGEAPDRQPRIERALVDAHLVVFLKTSSFDDSPWARREQRIALYNQKVSITISISSETKWTKVLLDIEIALADFGASEIPRGTLGSE
jgi:hypothetical protein